MLLFLGDYLHAPNKMYRCFPPRDIDDQRILRSDWIRSFWPVTCQTNFSQLQILYRKTKNFKVFQFRLLPAKSTEKKYENLKKLYFEPFLSILGQTTICLGNPSLSLFSVSRFLSLRNNSEKKIMNRVQKRTGDRRTDGQA